MTERAGKTRKSAAKATSPDAAAILQTALELAEEDGWSAVTLQQIATRLDLPMAAILECYRDKDALADAWFKTALAAMLAPPPAGLPPQERLHLLIMRWFDALAPHRRVTGQMLGEKLYPSHPHHWVPMIFNLSRTIQWLRDAALLTAGGRRRQIEEIGLTFLFLATLHDWLRDDSPGQECTRERLERRLARADRTLSRWRERD